MKKQLAAVLLAGSMIGSMSLAGCTTKKPEQTTAAPTTAAPTTAEKTTEAPAETTVVEATTEKATEAATEEVTTEAETEAVTEEAVTESVQEAAETTEEETTEVAETEEATEEVTTEAAETEEATTEEATTEEVTTEEATTEEVTTEEATTEEATTEEATTEEATTEEATTEEVTTEEETTEEATTEEATTEEETTEEATTEEATTEEETTEEATTEEVTTEEATTEEVTTEEATTEEETTEEATTEEETTEEAATEEATEAETDEQTPSGDTPDYLAQFEGLTADEEYSFPIIVKSFQSTYWQAALIGMDKAAEELGVSYDAQGPNSESDIADQVNMINSAINNGPVGLGLAACDTSSVLDSLQTCADQNIPVVAFDTGVADAPEGSIVCTVVTDNTQAGEVAAEHMYEAIKDVIANADSQVRIGEINQDATALNIQQRGLGFINKMSELIKADGKTVAVVGNEFYVNACDDAGDEKTADVVIEVGVPTQTTVELCSGVAQAILSKDDTIAIFGSNQTSAEGVLAADANLTVLGSDPSNGDVIGVGFDAGSTIKAAVADGTLYGAITQSPYMMGYYTLYALTAAANGQEVLDVPTDGYWYDASNMNDEEIAPNLYD